MSIWSNNLLCYWCLCIIFLWVITYVNPSLHWHLFWLPVIFSLVFYMQSGKRQIVRFQACMAGIVFAKFTKPTSRAETLMFSKQVVIKIVEYCVIIIIVTIKSKDKSMAKLKMRNRNHDCNYWCFLSCFNSPWLS